MTSQRARRLEGEPAEEAGAEERVGSAHASRPDGQFADEPVDDQFGAISGLSETAWRVLETKTPLPWRSSSQPSCSNWR